MDPNRQEPHITYTPLPPAKHHISWTSFPSHPLPLSHGLSFKLGQTSLRPSHQLHLFPRGSKRPHQAAGERGALALGEIRSSGETSGSGFGGFSPVPALALTAS